MEDKVRYILQQADNVMILGQRLSEWCGHGPVLEQDIAITNISLDLIGEARYLYQYAAELEGKKEDEYPFLRKEKDFYNCLLVELPNKDWAYTLIRQCIFDCFHFYFLKALAQCNDAKLSAIATKTAKEAQYHLRYSSEWVIRLGDGTEESHEKMQNAINDYCYYFDELFLPSEVDSVMVSSINAPTLDEIKTQAHTKFTEVMAASNLLWNKEVVGQKGGKKGYHTEHLGYILAEMQYMQRAYPGLEW